MISTSPSYRIGIDVGGTFTDFVLGGGGKLVRFKEPSVPSDPSLSVERGLPRLLDRAGVNAARIELVVHGTTIPLNAIIQRSGARLGLVVSAGNRGLLEIGRAQLPSAFNFLIGKEAPLVRRRLTLETSLRIGRDGAIVASAVPGEEESLARAYAAAGVEAVTVALINAHANPQAELDFANSLANRMPGVSVIASTSIWPEKREYERCMVALINAYVEPMMRSYLDKLKARIAALGVTAPVYVTSNNGGTLSLETARQRPIDTILSGPASGVVAAAAMARGTGDHNVITVDIGGTSADMSLIRDFTPAVTTGTRIENLPIIVPVIAVSAIGAGGGSIVSVDDHGMLKIGPRSAGSSPGPASYGRGGTEATITDCYVAAGYVDPDRFLGGRLRLDRAAAMATLDNVADALGLTGEHKAAAAAEAALRVATASMASEAARHLAQMGEHARNYALVAFGGAGPTHAAHLAEEAGIVRLVVPPMPSTFCALGAILSDVKRDFIVSQTIPLEAARMPEIVDTYAGLRRTACAWIAGEGDLLDQAEFVAVLDMRYQGQAFDLPVQLPEALVADPDSEAIAQLFHEAHQQVYSFRDPDSAIEITGLRLQVTGRIPPVAMPYAASSAVAKGPIPTRPVYLRGRWLDVPVHQRGGLAPGFGFAGPAIIEQEDTTTVLPEGWRATVDPAGNIVATFCA